MYFRACWKYSTSGQRKLCTSSKRDYSQIDAEVRKRLGTQASDTSFEYHLLRACVMIQRMVEDEDLAHDMVNELYLAIHDLRESFHDMTRPP